MKCIAKKERKFSLSIPTNTSIRCVCLCASWRGAQVDWWLTRLWGCDGNAWKWNFLFLNPARFQRFPLSHFPSSRYVLVTSLPTATQLYEFVINSIQSGLLWPLGDATNRLTFRRDVGQKQQKQEEKFWKVFIDGTQIFSLKIVTNRHALFRFCGNKLRRRRKK